MAGFESRSVSRLKRVIFVGVLIAMWLPSIVDSRSVGSEMKNQSKSSQSGLVWMTDELLAPENENPPANAEEEEGTLYKEFLDLLVELYQKQTSRAGQSLRDAPANGDIPTILIDFVGDLSLQEDMQADQAEGSDSHVNGSNDKPLSCREMQDNERRAAAEWLIKNRTLYFVGWLPKPPNGSQSSNKTEVVIQFTLTNNTLKNNTSNVIKKIEVIRPSCTVPVNVQNEWLKIGNESMYVYFDGTNFPKANATMTVTEALLRLYKLPVRINDKGSYAFDNTTTANASADHGTIRVNIFMIKDMKNKNFEHTLLCSATLLTSEEKLTTWNINKAVNIWRTGRKKNLGIMIEVEDEKRKKLAAQQFFTSVDCSGNNELSVPPINKLESNEPLPESWKAVLLDLTVEEKRPTKPKHHMPGPLPYQKKPEIDQSRNGSRERSTSSSET